MDNSRENFERQIPPSRHTQAHEIISAAQKSNKGSASQSYSRTISISLLLIRRARVKPLPRHRSRNAPCRRVNVCAHRHPAKILSRISPPTKCPHRKQAEIEYSDPRKDKSRRRSDSSFARIHYRRGSALSWIDVIKQLVRAHTLKTGFDHDGDDRGARLSPFVRTCYRRVKNICKSSRPPKPKPDAIEDDPQARSTKRTKKQSDRSAKSIRICSLPRPSQQNTVNGKALIFT